jgi:tRNA G18 (ribose-2'-O)-methylase SpoU
VQLSVRVGGECRIQLPAVFGGHLECWPRDLEMVREGGFRLLELTPDEKAAAIDEVAARGLERVALMLGAEGDGLSTRALVAAA